MSTGPPEELNWRAPHETTALFGHGEAERALLTAYRSGRQHHAMMLTGPAGIGKATLAYRFARFVFANPVTRSPAVRDAADLSVSPDARAARLIGRLAHPDFTVLHPDMFDEENRSGELKVDHVRWALGRITTTADADGWRVCVVDAADDLNRSAANALLKALEEPPPRTVFVLVAHRPGRLAATIRSRCIRVELAPLSEAETRAAVAEAAPDLASDPEIDTLIGLAGGAPGAALRLARSGGLELRRKLEALVAALPAIDSEPLHALASELAPARADDRFRLFMDLTLDWLAGRVRADALAGGGAGALEPWMELWDNVARAYEETLALNLDRKHLILKTFFGVESAARSAAAR